LVRSPNDGQLGDLVATRLDRSVRASGGFLHRSGEGAWQRLSQQDRDVYLRALMRSGAVELIEYGAAVTSEGPDSLVRRDRCWRSSRADRFMIRKGTPWITTKSLFIREGSAREYRRGSGTPIVLLHGGGLDSAKLSWGSPRIWDPAWSAITGLGLESSKLGAVAPSALHPKPGRWWPRSTATTSPPSSAAGDPTSRAVVARRPQRAPPALTGGLVQPRLVGEHCGFGPVADAELGEDRRKVVVDRLGRQAEPGGDGRGP
jgi:hypothetical protein